MRRSLHALRRRLFPQRADRWLVYALISTVLIVIGGSLLMWGLFRSQSVPSGLAYDDPQKTITVLIDRTPGGPSQWTPYIAVLKQMQEQMRVPVRAQYVAGRVPVAEAIEDPEIDAAFVSIYQYLMLPEDADFELLATPVVSGIVSDTAVIVVNHSTSEYRSFEDLRGASIALAPGASIRGYAYANWLAAQAGSTLERYFGEVQTGGEHSENLERVASGEVEAAAVGRSHLLAWPPGTFRIVEESPEVGMPPLIISTRLPQYFRDNLRDGLAQMGPGVGLPVDGLVEGFHFPTRDEYGFALELLEYVDASVLEPEWGASR